MIEYLSVKEGPVDINDLKARYLGAIKTNEGVVLPKFVHNGNTYLISDISPLINDKWLIVVMSENGMVTRFRVGSGDLVCDGNDIMLEEDRRVYDWKKYYDYWILDGRKPAPFFYEGIEYTVKSFTRIPGADEFWIVAERERGHWYTFVLSNDLKSKLIRHRITKDGGHQSYEWILENVKWVTEQRRYF